MREFDRSYIKSYVACACSRFRSKRFPLIIWDHFQGHATETNTFLSWSTPSPNTPSFEPYRPKYIITVQDEISSYCGLPVHFVSDRGTAFTSKIFREYCTEHRIKHILVAVRTPRAIVQVKRMNPTIQSMLLPSTENDRKWDSELRGP